MVSTHLIDKGALVLDLIRHVEVIQSVPPAQLLDNIRPQEVEADIEHSGEAFLVTDIHEVGQQILSNLDRVGTGGGNDGVLEQLVLFRQRDGIVPLGILLVQVSSQPPELKQSVLLQLLGKGDIVEIVETVNRVPKGVVVFLLDQKSVVGIVDSLNIQLRLCISRRSLGHQKLLTCCTAIRYERMSGMWSI